MSQDLGNRTEDSTIGFTWDTNSGAGGSIERGSPSGSSGVLYVEKIGALTGVPATISQANPGSIGDVAHGLVTGDEIFIYGASGMEEVNQQLFTVTRTDDDNFTIGVDTTGYTAYVDSATWVQICTVGLTDTERYKDVLGQHRCLVDLSAHAYYTTASDFEVMLIGAIIDGQTVNYTLRYFSIENRPISMDVTSISGSGTAADNLETACLAHTTARGLAGTALPNVAADVAGGLPVSDAGGLDLDALATAALVTTVDTVVDGIQTDLSNATDGLGALKALIDALNNFNPSSDMVKLGNVAHGGTAATLTLKSVAVDNSAGTAVKLKSTGGNGKGIDVAGDGSGEGVKILGGDSATAALYADCDPSSGIGILGRGATGVIGNGTGNGGGIKGVGGTSGHGIEGIGGNASGNGIQGTGQGGDDIGGAGVLGLFAAALGTMLTAVVQASPAPTDVECDTELSLTNPDQLAGRVILFRDGDNIYAQSVIRASTTGGLLTYDAIPVAPASGDTLVIV